MWELPSGPNAAEMNSMAQNWFTEREPILAGASLHARGGQGQEVQNLARLRSSRLPHVLEFQSGSDLLSQGLSGLARSTR